MKLAKPHLDIGLFTNDIAAQCRFWGDTVGLRLDHELPIAAGWVQHRYDAHGSVIKVNHRVEPLPALPPSGYVGLGIVRAGQPAWQGRHPGGDDVRLVPPGDGGIRGIAVRVRTPDPDRLLRFYLEAMAFEEEAANVARCGDSLLEVEEGAGGSHTDDFIGPGFRYLTVQVYDADAACAQIGARGGHVVRAPITLGEVARFGFVTDPDGNWIEISARASLGGRIAPT